MDTPLFSENSVRVKAQNDNECESGENLKTLFEGFSWSRILLRQFMTTLLL